MEIVEPRGPAERPLYRAVVESESKRLQGSIMVGESDTVSQTFSSARTGLVWIGGFFFIFLTIAVVATLFNEVSGGPSSRSPSQVRATGNNRRAAEPSLGLTPETATAVEQTAEQQ